MNKFWIFQKLQSPSDLNAFINLTVWKKQPNQPPSNTHKFLNLTRKPIINFFHVRLSHFAQFANAKAPLTCSFECTVYYNVFECDERSGKQTLTNQRSVCVVAPLLFHMLNKTNSAPYRARNTLISNSGNFLRNAPRISWTETC